MLNGNVSEFVTAYPELIFWDNPRVFYKIISKSIIIFNNGHRKFYFELIYWLLQNCLLFAYS